MNIGMRWGVLCERLGGWIGIGPEKDRLYPEPEFQCERFSADEIAGLALVAALMGFVECATHCPLMYHTEGKRSWEAAQARHGSLKVGRWEDLSEAMRHHWISMLVSAALKGSLDEVLR